MFILQNALNFVRGQHADLRGWIARCIFTRSWSPKDHIKPAAPSVLPPGSVFLSMHPSNAGLCAILFGENSLCLWPMLEQSITSVPWCGVVNYVCGGKLLLIILVFNRSCVMYAEGSNSRSAFTRLVFHIWMVFFF